MKNRAYLICLLLLACIVQYSTAQESPAVTHTHTVFTKDGSKLKGAITGWSQDTVTLTLMTGIRMQIPATQVARIESADIEIEDEEEDEVRTYIFKDQGIYNVTTIGVSVAPELTFGVTHAVGYRFSTALGVGIGTGIESFEVGSGTQNVPLFVEARGFLLKRNMSPYYAARVGHGFAVLNNQGDVTDAQGGVLVHLEAGYRFGGSRSASFFTGIGFHWQNAKYLYEQPWESVFLDKVTHRRTEVRVGVIF